MIAPALLSNLDSLARRFADIAETAGEVIEAIAARPTAARLKTDASPVTEADEAAEALILAALRELLPDVPVVAEESVAAGRCPSIGEDFILVDPLDGTREFLKRNGEYTVNIGLVRAGIACCGAVHAPAQGLTWYGATRAWRRQGPDGEARAIRTRPAPATGLVALASRSHGDAETGAFLARLPVAEHRAAGSSLKFCLIAEGAADVYPRFGPTMEWDIAAGHAVLRAAGGVVLSADGISMTCGHAERGFRNGSFVAWGDPAAAARFG